MAYSSTLSCRKDNLSGFQPFDKFEGGVELPESVLATDGALRALLSKMLQDGLPLEVMSTGGLDGISKGLARDHAGKLRVVN
jgi:hypothetical protein